MIQDTILDGSLLVAMPIALLAGLVSFLSPCVLPLVPGYLSFVTGLTGADLAEATVTTRQRSRVVLGGLLFVLGFSVVFVSAGAAFGAAGRVFNDYADTITRVLGVVTIVLGLAFMGALSRLPLFSREFRIHALPKTGLAGAPLLGVLFGVGWTPCLGPTLAAVQNLAFQQATAGRGALLGLAYCLGLGVPFVLVALGARWAMGATSFLRRHAQAVTRFGGAVLVVVGLLLVTGAWTEMMRWLQGWLAANGFAESVL